MYSKQNAAEGSLALEYTLLPDPDRRPRRIWPVALIALVICAYFGFMLTLRRIPWFYDIKFYYYPAWKYIHQSFGAGAPPLWCPGIYCGFPLFADSETGLFYPVNLLLFRLPVTAGFNYSIIIHYLLGGWFTYLYCRRLGLERSASVFAAVPFVLGGFYLAHFAYPNVAAAAAWMPLFLYLQDKALESGRLSLYVAAGGVLGLQFLAGFLMVPLMQLMLAFFYALLHPLKTGEKRAKSLVFSLGGLALAAAIGAGLGMVQNLPSYNLVQNSFRAGGLSRQAASVNNLPPAHLLGLVFPRAFGMPGYYRGAWLFEETTSYMGVLPLLFAPLAFTRPRRWHALFFGGAALASLFLCLGDPGLLWRAVRLLPGFDVLRGPARFLLVFDFSLAVLGGMGFDRWRKGEFTVRERKRVVVLWSKAALALAALITAVTILYRYNPLRFRDFLAAAARPLFSGFKQPTRAVLDGLYGYFSSPRFHLFVPLLVLLFFFALLGTGRKEGRPGRVKVAAALIVLVAELLILYPYFVFVPVDKVESKPPVVDALLSEASGGRVALVKEKEAVREVLPLCSNQLLPYGIDDAHGFSTISPLRTSHFLNRLDSSFSAASYELMGVSLLFTSLVSVEGVPYDVSFPFPLRCGIGARSYRRPGMDIARLSLLLDGTLLETEASGSLYLAIGAGSGESVEAVSVLRLQKEAGEESCRVESLQGEGSVSSRRVSFGSGRYRKLREALELTVAVEIPEEVGVLTLASACGRGLDGTRVIALEGMDGTGNVRPVSVFQLAYLDEKNAVYRTEGPRPRAWFAWNPAWCGSWRSAEAASRRIAEDPGGVSLVEGEVPQDLAEAMEGLEPSAPDARVYDFEEGRDRVTLRASNASDSILVLSISYLPGWKARVDGVETPLFSAYGFLSALYLPGGDHEVELAYNQPGLAAGGLATSLTLLFAALAFVLLRRRERAAESGTREAPAPLPPPSEEGISAFFPCYNDAATLREVVEKALTVLPDLAREYEVIIVDDGSTDASTAVAAELERAYPRVRLVRHERNRGYGGALRSGIAASTLPWVFYTDSDGQYDVEELRRLHALSGAADVINGYKRNRSDPWYRRAMGGAYNLAVRQAFAVPIRDVDCDFRLMRGELVRGLDLRSDGGAICVELVKGLQAAGASFAETPVGHYPRRSGKSQFFRLENLLVMLRELAALWCRLTFRKEA